MQISLCDEVALLSAGVPHRRWFSGRLQKAQIEDQGQERYDTQGCAPETFSHDRKFADIRQPVDFIRLSVIMAIIGFKLLTNFFRLHLNLKRKTGG